MSHKQRKPPQAAAAGKNPAGGPARRSPGTGGGPSSFSLRTWLAVGVLVAAAIGFYSYLQAVQRNLNQANSQSAAQVAARGQAKSNGANPSAAPAATANAAPANAATNNVTAAAAKRSWDRPLTDDQQGWLTTTKQCDVWCEVDNPQGDGWNSEVASSSAMKQFDKLKKVLTHAGALEPSGFEFLADEAVQVAALRPTDLRTTYQDAQFHAERSAFDAADAALARITSVDAAAGGEAAQAPAAEANEEFEVGRGALAAELTRLLAPFSSPEKLRIKIKVFNVEMGEAGQFRTHQTLEVYGPTAAGEAEINSVWHASWQLRDGEPRLQRLQVKAFETVARRGERTFVDHTGSVLGQNPRFTPQLLKGYNHWFDRKQFKLFYGGILGTPGVAVADVNGDGRDDLYICQEDGLPNLLFLQEPDGTLRDATAASGADWLVESRAALLIDLDNDRALDLVVAATGGLIVAQGDGAGHFTLRTVLDTQDDVMSLSAADYDNDGKVDLYAGVYMQTELRDKGFEIPLVSAAFLIYDATNGGQNSLWKNENGPGAWAFRDVTAETGLDHDNHRFTLASGWEDIDNDGDQDLYVANDFGRNNLFRNDAGPGDTGPGSQRRFVDIAAAGQAEDANFGMSVSWADYDHNGWMDLYISNMFSYAGNRVMYQQQFKPGTAPEILEQFRRTAKGNTLLRNLGVEEQTSDGTGVPRFEDRSLAAAVNRGRWAWGSRFVDINNDSWDDLVVANGFITTDDTGDL